VIYCPKSAYFYFPGEGGEGPDPATVLEVLDRSCDDEAKAWIDSTPRIREIMTKPEIATDIEVKEIKGLIVGQFPIIDVPEQSAQSDIGNMTQYDDESLGASYIRCQYALRRTHGRDKSETKGA
jgi:hypothetical protein